jgi:hypothetical protein
MWARVSARLFVFTNPNLEHIWFRAYVGLTINWQAHGLRATFWLVSNFLASPFLTTCNSIGFSQFIGILRAADSLGFRVPLTHRIATAWHIYLENTQSVTTSMQDFLRICILVKT